jgi:hypothetical protein
MFRGQFLVALATVKQMALHRCARLRDCTGLDRLNDLLVLLLEDIELNAALGQICALPDRSARNDEAAEVLQEACELRISGGSGNRTMEPEILVTRAVAAIDCCLNGIESVDDLLTCAGVARSAARPAASISTPVRSSMTLSTSRSGECSSKSTRNGRRT